MDTYAHLIEIDENTKVLSIYRVYPGGKKELFTSTELPKKSMSEDKESFSNFATQLGENLLVDSPIARHILGI